ncbi:MAG: SMP-30/gluconolactonase/LRE family protein [Saprospiraceae bacterium]|nr:SMP-30/gluconolactonase/LRE family protein [Saprospiraceae bacterium]
MPTAWRFAPKEAPLHRRFLPARGGTGSNFAGWQRWRAQLGLHPAGGRARRLAFDADGNLYVSCYSPNKIYKVTPSGEVTVFMDDWEAHTISNPTNIAFGGPNLDQLFAANLGRWHITKIDAGVRGLALASHDG